MSRSGRNHSLTVSSINHPGRRRIYGRARRRLQHPAWSHLALRRQGRAGLVFLDGHSDFRHPDNAEAIGAAAGEDLSIISGRGDTRLTDLEGLRPLISDEDVAAAWMRPTDEHIHEMKAHGISVVTVEEMKTAGVAERANVLLDRVTRPELGCFWIHLDVDILDPDMMPAVDTPTQECSPPPNSPTCSYPSSSIPRQPASTSGSSTRTSIETDVTRRHCPPFSNRHSEQHQQDHRPSESTGRTRKGALVGPR